MNFWESVKAFDLRGGAASIKPYGDGHINDTFLVTVELPRPRYILQRINKNVFREPEKVMENIAGVTAYLREQVLLRGGDADREVLNVVKTKRGESFHIDPNGDYWRVYLFVEDTNTFQLPDTPELFYESARAFGTFGAMLQNYPARLLNETIPGFHDTPGRYRQLAQAVKADPLGRVSEVKPELDFVMAREREAGTLCQMLAAGGLPLRVAHNDAKLNNVLLDAKTGRGACVIDLDTVMPGLFAHDFGDSIRFGANTAAEDERDLEKCSLSLPMFEAYTQGYLECAHSVLTDTETEALPLGAKLMTLECGVRFLADHINGDAYFKIHREKQNLDRARTQFKLVQDMEQKWKQMNAIVCQIAGRW